MGQLLPWSGIFRVNSIASSDQYDASVVTLPDGRFAATWISRTGDWTSDPWFDARDIHGRIFNPGGIPAGDDIVVHASPSPDWDPRAAALVEGGFVVSWTANPAGSNIVHVKSVGADGSPGALEKVIGKAQESAIATLEDGRVAVAWIHRDGPWTYNVVTSVWNPDGTASIGAFAANATGEPGQQEYPTITALGGGGFLVTWVAKNARDGDGYGLFGQVFSASGVRVGAEFGITVATAGYQYDAHAAGLADGGFVVSWTSPDGDGYGVWARVFDAAGTPVTGDIALATTTAFDQGQSVVAALPGGGFVAVWRSDQQGVMARSFGADGTPDSPEHVVMDWRDPDFAASWPPFWSPSAGVLPDGRVVVSAHQPGAASDVFARIIDTRSDAVALVGTEAADFLAGTPLDDRVDGAAGNDTLVGGPGNDTIVGGAGDDELHGTTGFNRLNGVEGRNLIHGGDLYDLVLGGTGDDTIHGNDGNDALRGLGGADLIFGGLGADTLIGNEGDDTLAGGGGADEMHGGAGDDFVNGGFGSDRVNGGAGTDTFYHLGIADHGSDWIQDYSAADGDVLLFGGAAARDRFQVNVAETPAAGAAGVAEAFVIYRPTGQILWALVDGAAQGAINIQTGGQVFDLLA